MSTEKLKNDENPTFPKILFFNGLNFIQTKYYQKR